MSAHSLRQRDIRQLEPTAADAMRQLAAHALEAVVTMDASGRLTGWNGQAQQLFGWSADEVVGRQMDEVIIPPRYRKAHRAGLTRFLLTGEGRLLDTRTDVRALRRDGQEIDVEIAITVLREADRITFVGFLRDLTERRRLEEALFETEQRLAGVISHLPGIAYVERLGGDAIFVSDKVEDILGYTIQEWLDNPNLWSQLLHPDDRDRARADLRQAAAIGGSFSYVYRLIARDGAVVWIRDQSTVHREGDGSAMVSGVMFDITHERSVETELEVAIADRTAISASLRRLPTGRPAMETAQAICHELLRIPHLDIAVVYEFAHDGSVVPIGQISPPGAPIATGRPLPASRAEYLRASATGPWIDEWHAKPDDNAYLRAWLDVGLTCGAFVPFGANGATFGLLSAGTTANIGSEGVSRWLPALTEFAAIAAALLGHELSARRTEDGTRAELHRIIDMGELSPVYQPIVHIADGAVVGFEALTRFADGQPPDRRFALADAIGVGPDLERAAITTALDESTSLPPDLWVSVNVSPSRLVEPDIIHTLSAHQERPLVVEVTERLPIDDYEAVRRMLAALPGSIEVAVDDAGAGFASLRHILELRPRYVKLDKQLVRGVDRDPARQALIAGMVYFARQSGCRLVAEGIETEAERDTLRTLGVPYGQGFVFGRPAPASAWSAS
jgi:PAS domain S-box-containing protein